MFNKLVVGTMMVLSSAFANLTVREARDNACQVYGGDDFTHFNLTTLDKNGTGTYAKDQIEWRFCDHLPSSYYFAHKVDLRRGVIPLSTDSYEVDEVKVMNNNEGELTGVALTRYSEEVCKTNGTTNTYYTFSTVVTCDRATTAVGGGIVTAMNKTNECAPVAYVKHAAGCPVFTANEFVRDVKKSPWVLALVSIGLGLYIAFKGRM